MAKITAKRRREEPLVDTHGDTKRTRSTAKLAAKSVAHETSDEDDASFVAEKSYQTRKPQGAGGREKAKLARVTRSGEYDEDPGRYESQQILKLAKSATENKISGKVNKCLKVFQKVIDKELDNLSGSVNDQEAQLTARNDEFFRSFRVAYSSVLKTGPSKESTLISLNQGKDAHKLYQKSIIVMKKAMSLASYSQLSEASIVAHDTAMSVSTNWKLEINHTKDVLEMGRQVGIERVAGILGIHRDEQTDAEALNVVEHLFEKKIEASEELNWATIARKQEKAVRKLVKVLPHE